MAFGSVNTHISIAQNTQDFPPSIPFMGTAIENLEANDVVVGVRKSNWATFMRPVPLSSFTAGNGNGVAISPNSRLMGIAHTTTPFVTFYKIEDSDFTKIEGPDVLPAGNGVSIAFSPKGDIVGVVHVTSPFVTFYRIINGETNVTFERLPNPDVLPSGTGSAVDFSSNGRFVAVSNSTTAPICIVYRINADYTFTKLANLPSLPTGTPDSRDVKFSPSSRMLSVAHSASPIWSNYSVVDETFTKLANISGYPSAPGAKSCAFSPDEKLFVGGGTASPYVYLWRIDGEEFTKITNPASAGGTTRRISFSVDGKFCAGAIEPSPYMVVYSVDGETFSKLPSPSVLPTGITLGVAFSSNGNNLAFAHTTLPNVTIYRTQSMDALKKVSLFNMSFYALNNAEIFAGAGFVRAATEAGDSAVADMIFKGDSI